MATTTDAYMWTPEEGLRHGGFTCEGVVSPPRNVKSPEGTVYDVLIIGGGYAGLAAARDLTTAGKPWAIFSLRVILTISIGRSVLLIEGRDRLGGRSYTIEHNGKAFQTLATEYLKTSTRI